MELLKHLLAGLAITTTLSGCLDQNQAIAERAKAAAKDRLRDPESAKFRGLKVHKVADAKLSLEHGQANATRDVVCGDINASNAYGGMIGYSAFIVVLGLENDKAPDEVFFSPASRDEDENEKFDKMFSAACMGNGIKVGS